MVQFLKAKPTSFINKPVGIVSTDTGGQKAGQVLANVAQNIATQAFAFATKDQEKFGKDYARTMKIDIRDENGNLQFKDIDSTLSDVARASAEPLVRQRYGEALQIDINNQILNIRKKSKSAEEFKTNVETTMGEYVTSLRQFGGGDYEGIVTQDIARISSQHFNDMSTDEFKEKLKIAATNKQFIIEQSKNDYITSISDSVSSNSNASGDVGGIKDLVSELNVSKFIIDKLLQENDANLTENDQNPAIHGKEYRDLKRSTTIGLMRGLIGGKKGDVLRAVRRNILNNEPTVDRNGKELLNDYEKEVLNLIKKQNYDEAAIKELEGTLTIVAQDESNFRAVSNWENKQQNNLEKTLQEKSISTIFEIQEKDKIFNESSNIANKIAEQEDLTEDDINNINKLSQDILQKKEFTVGELDGEKVGFKFTDEEVIRNTSFMLQNISTKVMRQSGLFTTSSDKENLVNYIRNDNDIGLTEPQKKVANKIKKVFSAVQSDVISKQRYADGFGSYLIQSAIDESRQEQNLITRQKINIVGNEAQNGIGQYSTERSKQLNEFFSIDRNYFAQGKFQEGLIAQEESPEYKKANSIDLAITNGQPPAALIELFSMASTGNLSAYGVNAALNFFNKYTRVEKSGGVVDRLVDILDKKTYNLLSTANSLQMYVGSQAFGITPRQGQTGIDSGQIMQKLIETQQTMDKNSRVFQANLESLTPDDTTIKTSFDFLLRKYGFDIQESNNLAPIMDIFISLGVDKNTIDNHFQTIQEAIYADGEGTIVDATGGGKVLTRSRYSLLKTVPDDYNRSKVRQFIQNDLSFVPVPRKETDLETKFILNYTPNATEFEKQIRSKRGKELLQKRREEEKTGTRVYLQPISYGPDQSNVRYNAVYRDNTGIMRPVMREGLPVVYDLKDIMERLNPDFDPDE